MAADRSTENFNPL